MAQKIFNDLLKPIPTYTEGPQILKKIVIALVREDARGLPPHMLPVYFCNFSKSSVNVCLLVEKNVKSRHLHEVVQCTCHIYILLDRNLYFPGIHT